MSLYKVVLAVARAAVLETGRSIEMCVLAKGKLDAAIQSEKAADMGLGDCEYTHTLSVKRIDNETAIAMAA